MVNKRYYWLKLQEAFFTDKRIKRLRKIAGGDTYTIIYLKLLLLSLQDEGKLYFDNVEDSFIEELALELDEDEDNVQVTINYLIAKGMLEIISDDEYFLTELPAMIGSETASTRRSRKSREKAQITRNNENLTKALQCNTKATGCNKKATESKSIEKEINKEKDIYIEDRELERESPPPPQSSNISTNLSTELYTSNLQLRKEVKEILKPYISIDDIHMISVKLEKRLNEGLKADKEYLQEKIDFMEYEGKNIKECFGYFAKVVEEDWSRSKKPFKKTSETTFKKNSFHNFEQSKTEQYSEEALNALLRDRNRN